MGKITEERKDLGVSVIGRINVKSELWRKWTAAAIVGFTNESICASGRNVLPITH